MYGYEQIRTVAPRFLITLAQRNIVITVTHQHCMHAGPGVYGLLELACDGQYGILFPRTPGTLGARIFTTMPGIDGDHHITVGLTDIVKLFDSGAGIAGIFTVQ